MAHVREHFNERIVAEQMDPIIVAGRGAKKVVETLRRWQEILRVSIGGLRMPSKVPLAKGRGGVSGSLQDFRYGDLIRV